ncbi:MAG: hypothetical protein QN170_08020, partial [Armatimonadota bacterium]|nr:hypothetical protein [Armatimonadota bacterium]
MSGSTVRVGRYELMVDRLYDPEHHLWVLPVSDTRVRVGFDPLGVEVNGTLAQLVLAPLGTVVRRGEAFGSLEAAKFVGPLVAPVSGRVVAQNPVALSTSTVGFSNTVPLPTSTCCRSYNPAPALAGAVWAPPLSL